MAPKRTIAARKGGSAGKIVLVIEERLFDRFAHISDAAKCMSATGRYRLIAAERRGASAMSPSTRGPHFTAQRLPRERLS
jgi:hypothetical protein